MFKRKSFKPAPDLKPLKYVQVRYTDPSTPAASINLIKQAGISFEKKVESAVKVNLAKGGKHAGVRWSVIGLLDESYSMDRFFDNGTVQEIVERALAWCATRDNDGAAPFGAFANGHVWHDDVDLTGVAGIVNREGWRPWGGTDLTASLDAILSLIHEMGDNWIYDPIFLLIVTDGRPKDQKSVVDRVQKLSQYPVFIKILRVGNDRGAQEFTAHLDDMEDHSPGSRLLDNVDCPKRSLTKGMSDDEFNEMMTDETESFIDAGLAAGLLTA